jgi:hypothetical protein
MRAFVQTFRSGPDFRFRADCRTSRSVHDEAMRLWRDKPSGTGPVPFPEGEEPSAAAARPATLSAAEVEQRLPVWHALSELFLDTELQSADYARIGDQLRRSGYSAEELHRIYRSEVVPAFIADLYPFDVAGEWLPWSAEEVRENMLRSLALGSPTPPMTPRQRRRIEKGIDASWERIPL